MLSTNSHLGDCPTLNILPAKGVKKQHGLLLFTGMREADTAFKPLLQAHTVQTTTVLFIFNVAHMLQRLV